MARSVTLKDVAREAGVHVSTASRALNSETRSIVNAKTADKVVLVAKRLGYHPHPLARGLRTNRTYTIGMIVPDLMNPLFPPIYAGAAAALSEFGYSLVIVENEDPAKEQWVTAALIERRVDGLILATAHLDSAPVPTVTNEDVPTVLVNRAADKWNIPSIVGDDHAGIGLAVRHLVSLGHKSIAHVAGPRNISTGLTRRQAFVAWMSSEGLDPRPDLIVEADSFRIDSGHQACERLLASKQEFTAIVTANDLIALGCFDSLKAHGIEVPGQVSVTGYNNLTFIDRVTPPMTTVDIPYREMGAEAARVLLDLLAHDSTTRTPPTSTRLTPSLIVRESTGPAPTR